LGARARGEGGKTFPSPSAGVGRKPARNSATDLFFLSRIK
jgi:hypothetical protein